ncbi:MAG: TRAP transporter large permease subunit [Gammaproteobacteria bacterium]|nr:TRAP transporter large permease subunit [Gammaproteobacteria bacterium]
MREPKKVDSEGWLKALPLKTLAWCFAVTIPVVLYAYLSHLQVDRHDALFATIVCATLLMWVFSLLADFIPALVALLAMLLFGLAPESVVLSGFSSSGFLLALSIMGLGVVIVESGLARRYTLILLRHLPANTFSHQLSVFFTGLLFTPVVPTINGRASVVGPVVNHVVEDWDAQTKSSSSTMLYTTGLDSIHYLAPCFLTAAPANLMIFAMLPAQEQQAYHFLFWTFAASVTGLCLLLFYFLCSAAFFHKAYRRVEIPHGAIEKNLAELGPMSANERIALGSIVLLAVGVVTAPLHKIEIHFVAFIILCLLLFMGSMQRQSFIAKIDWAFLVLLASMIGLLSTMNYLGLDLLISSKLTWLGSYMRQSFALFVLALAGVMLLVRLFIPLNQAILIFAAALIPIASNAGIAPWVIGFVILIFAETAFFAYQSPYIFLFREITNKVTREERKVRVFHGMLVLCKLLAVYISIPFWSKIGVL